MALALRRPKRRRGMLSVVSMIDVMMILLFFFMITSSYLNLDMVPVLEKTTTAAPATQSTAGAGAGGTLLVQITPSGTARIAGQSLDMKSLSALVHVRIKANPLTRVLLFPSGAADLQALISVMDAVTRAGAERVKVIRIKGQP